MMHTCALSGIFIQLADMPPPLPPPIGGVGSGNAHGLIPAILAFVLTMTIEWPILAWLSGLGFKKTGLFCLCLNAVTWGIGMGLAVLWPVPMPLLEALIILVEAALLAWYWHWRAPRALGISAAMNLTSWLAGTFVLGLFHRL